MINYTMHTVYSCFLLPCLFFSFPACLPFSLYFSLAENQTGVPSGQQGVGVSEVSIIVVDSSVILESVVQMYGSGETSVVNCYSALNISLVAHSCLRQ